MTQITPGLQKKIASNPNSSFDTIVRVNGDMDQAQNSLTQAGFQIRRKLGLIKGYAVTGPGKAVAKLASQSWVNSIEEDQQVHTQDKHP